MPITVFLNSVEGTLNSGSTTEHAHRPALKRFLEQMIAECTATNKPEQAEHGAPDFVIQQGTVPIGHVEARDIGGDLRKSIADSERAVPRTPDGKQLKRYRAALPNLIYTDGLEWHWFVGGTPRLSAPVRIATWHANKKKLHRNEPASAKLATLLHQFSSYRAEQVATPNDLAWRLAQIARWLDEVITTVLTTEGTHGALHQHYDVCRQTLLPTMTPAEFADMYAQTIVYGLFAARVAVPTSPAFTRADATQTIPQTNPFVQELFSHLAGPRLDERIAWLVDDCARLLERTNMAEVLRDFGKATGQEDPVIHFYETFLAAYDPQTRERRGVYYTPEPVVSYIVRSVDCLLQTRFGKPLGLADEAAFVLDPAMGTATFLHAVVQHIHTTLTAMGLADTWNQYVPEKLLPRLTGFEVLMSPYTIAHHNISMLLQQLGYTFGGNERPGIFLTNALMAPSHRQTSSPPFLDFLGQKGRQAQEVKQQNPVMVVLGNPPYANFGMLNKGAWIQEQLEEYKRDVRERKLNLDDDFIKFIRLGQWLIEQTGQGILAFITNNTYLDGVTHRRMRQSLIETFTDIYMLDLHGSSLKKEVCPDGSPDENVFDIRQGVAIALFVKEPGKTGNAKIHHAEMWGKRQSKYTRLQETDVHTTRWQDIFPRDQYFFLVPKDFQTEEEYTTFRAVQSILVVQQGAIKTDRDTLFFDMDRTVLEDRMRVLYTEDGLAPAFRATYRVENTSSYNLLSRRQTTTVNLTNIQRCLYRPFDNRWLYYDAAGLTSRPAYDVMRHLLPGKNIALLVCRQQALTGFSHVLCTEYIAESHAVSLKTREGAFVFPLYRYPNGNKHPLPCDHTDGRCPNLSPAFIQDVEQRLGLRFIPHGQGDLDTTIGPEDVFHYLYAVLHSPTYRARYAELLKIDFPRVPITSDKAVFATLVSTGAALVDLHLLRLPESGGVGGAGGAAILRHPDAQGVTQHQVPAVPIVQIRYDALHRRVFIDRDHYVEGIAPETWGMTIGSYQPLQKWLKDRKGHALSCDDTTHYMRMVIALRETRRLMGEIDALIPAWPFT